MYNISNALYVGLYTKVVGLWKQTESWLTSETVSAKRRIAQIVVVQPGDDVWRKQWFHRVRYNYGQAKLNKANAPSGKAKVVSGERL